MSRPEGVDEDAMRKAENALRDAPYSVGQLQATARAIMAERERAAAIVDAECSRVLSKQNGRDDGVDHNLRMIAVLLPDLAAAIRSPSRRKG